MYLITIVLLVVLLKQKSRLMPSLLLSVTSLLRVLDSFIRKTLHKSYQISTGSLTNISGKKGYFDVLAVNFKTLMSTFTLHYF